MYPTELEARRDVLVAKQNADKKMAEKIAMIERTVAMNRGGMLENVVVVAIMLQMLAAEQAGRQPPADSAKPTASPRATATRQPKAVQRPSTSWGRVGGLVVDAVSQAVSGWLRRRFGGGR